MYNMMMDSTPTTTTSTALGNMNVEAHESNNMIPRRMSGRVRRRPTRRPASLYHERSISDSTSSTSLAFPTRRTQSLTLEVGELEQACSDAATEADNLVGLSQRTTSLVVNRIAGELSPLQMPTRRSVSLDPAFTTTTASRPPMVPTSPTSNSKPGAYNTKGRPADLPPWLSNDSMEQRRLRLSQVDRMSWKTLARWLECKNNSNDNQSQQQEQQEQSQQQEEEEELPVATPVVVGVDSNTTVEAAEVVVPTTSTTTAGRDA